MEIIFHKKFEKQLSRLNRSQQQVFSERILIFQNNRFDPILNNHILHGKLQNKRSINISGDLRIIYEEVEEDVFLFLEVGTHSELYKN